MAFLLIPSEVVPFERGRTVARPKYIGDLKISFSGCDLHRFGYFLVMVNDRHKDTLLAYDGVIDTDDVVNVNQIKARFNLKKTNDIISSLGKLIAVDFKKEKLRVSDG